MLPKDTVWAAIKEQVLSLPAAVDYIMDRIGPAAAVVDTTITTTEEEPRAGPQKLHSDHAQ